MSVHPMKSLAFAAPSLAFVAVVPLLCQAAEPPIAPSQQSSPSPEASAKECSSTQGSQASPGSSEPSTIQGSQLTTDQLLDFLSRTIGASLATEWLTRYQELTPADLDLSQSWNGVLDGARGGLAPSMAHLDSALYELALQNLLHTRKTGSPLSPDPQLSQDEKASFQAALQNATRIPEHELLGALSYLTAFDLSQDLSRELCPFRPCDLQKNAFEQGVGDQFAGRRKDICDSAEDVNAYLTGLDEFFNRRADEEGNDNLWEGEAFLAENSRKEGVVTTPSGLQYRVLSSGTGERYDREKHGDDAYCLASSRGQLLDGSIFLDEAEPTDLRLNAVPPGLREALQIMPIGSEWELYIPASLGFGEDAPNGVGRNCVLIVTLKLLGIHKASDAQEEVEHISDQLLNQLQESEAPSPPYAQPDTDLPTGDLPLPEE